jgi:hypothetical protein
LPTYVRDILTLDKGGAFNETGFKERNCEIKN